MRAPLLSGKVLFKLHVVMYNDVFSLLDTFLALDQEV